MSFELFDTSIAVSLLNEHNRNSNLVSLLMSNAERLLRAQFSLVHRQ